MKKKNLVRYFRPVLNWILEHIYLIITIVVLIIVYLNKKYINLNNIWNDICTKLQNMESSEIATEVFTGVVITILTAFLTFVWKKVKSNLVISYYLKRSLYNKGHRLYENRKTPKSMKNIISYFVNLFYFHKKTVIKEQQEAIDDILSSMNNDLNNRNKIYWIVGNSYSGKTTTVLNLLWDLIAKEPYVSLFQKLDGNIVYFDLSRPEESTTRFEDEYMQGAFSHCLIILDNLQELSEKRCFSIVNKLIIEKNFFALLVLLRKPDDFIGENASMLKEIIKENGSCYQLKPLSTEIIEIRERRKYYEFCTLFFPRNIVDANNHIQVHLYTLYQKQDADFARMIPEIQAFLDISKIGACSIVPELFAVIVCSLFSGSFNLHFAASCDPHLTENQLRRTLNSLSKIGFLTLYPNSHDNFFFHEKLAKAYFKYTYPKRKAGYLAIFRHIAASNPVFENAIFKFLYQMPVQQYDQQKVLFEEIVNNSNFLNLYENMKFLFDVGVCTEKDYYKELGILCDRSGKLKEAKRLYEKYFIHTHSIDAFYKLVQVDHAMINSNLKDLIVLNNANDSYDCVLRDYWRIHIDMHAGHFEFKKIYELAQFTQKWADTIIANCPYDGLHLIRRLYFDVFRLYYLEGILNPQQLRFLTSEKSNLYLILCANLEEFEAYYYKFAIGMMLGMDVLFALEFKTNSFKYDDYQFLFKDQIYLERKDVYHSNVIAQKAVEAYQWAINYMCSIGDKTQIFVKYHMYNVKMFLIQDGDYSDCDDFYEEYRSFAESENVPEYMAYARLYRIKLIFIKLCSLWGIDPDYTCDETRNEWQAQLSEALEQAENEDAFLNNQYADLRLMIYRNLFEYICNLQIQPLNENLEKMIDIAEKNHYNREQIIFQYMKHQLDGYGLSFKDVKKIVTCYPIVPQ